MGVVFLVIGEILCYLGQEFFSKLFSITHPDKASDVTPIFNVLFGAVVALATWIYNGFRLNPDWITLLIGVINGAALFMYNFSAIHAAQSGPYTLQSIMSAFGNILIPLLVSIIIWSDRLRLIQGIGIALMLAAFVLYNAHDLHGLKIGFKGFGWFVLVFATNGVYSALNDAQQRIEAGGYRTDMIIISFLTTAVISAVSLIISRNPNVRSAAKMPPRAMLFAVAASVSAAAAINLLMTALNYVPSYLLYPIGSGSLLILNTLLGRIVLKEKIQPLQYIGITAATIAIILTNL